MVTVCTYNFHDGNELGLYCLLALRFGDGALVLGGRKETDIGELAHRHLDALHRPVRVVRYMHVHSYVLTVVI